MAKPREVEILDGAMGSLLAARGVRVDGPAWSARALIEAPDEVAAIHRDYAAAGARIHTTNTFRADTPELIAAAVQIARDQIGDGLLAGSIGPAADCYRPDQTPPVARTTLLHRRKAALLVAAGVHLLLFETFAHHAEAVAAVEACSDLGVPVWLSLTGGPDGALASPSQVARMVMDAAALGVARVLVGCTDARLTLAYLQALRPIDVPLGACANAGSAALGHLVELGPAPSPGELRARARRYAGLALGWADAGADVIGGCCGTFPEHIEALRELFRA